MKLETFFEKFDQFAEAPGAVAKMRKLVLNLAVQGSLVHQDPADEDVELLLVRNDEVRRAAAKSDRRADAGKKTLLSADDRWEIAESWSWRALADLVLFVDYRGKTPAKLSDGIRLLTAKNVRKGEINLAPEEFLSEEEYHSWMTRGFPKAGDVLFTTEAPMGNAAVVKLTDRFALAQRVICFQSYGAIDSSFLVLQILSTQFQAILDKNGTGVTAKGIKASKLKQLPIALPPLAEQKRIVAKVGELMALCDRLEAQQQERETGHAALARASLDRFADAPTPANLNLLFHSSFPISPSDLRKSILTLAVQGKLVPQDPNDEPAEASIECVSKDAKQAIRDGIIRRHGLEETPDDSDLSELPFGWRWTRLVEVTLPVKYAIKRGPFGSAIRKDMFVPTGFKIYEQQHAISGDFTKGCYCINEAKFHELSAFELYPGEILVSCSGTVGKVAIVPANIERGIINQALLKLSLHQSALLNEYFLILFPAFFMETDRLTNLSGTAQKNIPGMDVLKAMPFPLPPLAEQRRIVAKVSELMALVDELETQLDASRAAAEKLLSALVAELTGTTSLLPANS